MTMLLGKEELFCLQRGVLEKPGRHGYLVNKAVCITTDEVWSTTCTTCKLVKIIAYKTGTGKMFREKINQNLY